MPRWMMIGLLAALAGVAIGLWVFWPQSDILNDSETVPGIHIVNPRLVGHHEGRRQWELRSARMHEQNGIVHMQTVSQGVIVNDSGGDLYFEADSGRWMRSSGDLYLYGDVTLADDDGFSLVTSEMFWTASAETLTAPQPVQIEFRDAVTTANAMLVDMRTDTVNLTGEVMVEEGTRTWRMPRLVYHLQDETMEFFGAVALEMGGGGEP